MKKFGFFNSVNGDRKYLATDISNAFDIAVGTGLAPKKDCFKIAPNEKMTVKMKTGGAMIRGFYVTDDEEEIIQLDTANGEYARIDRIVLRYDKFERNVKTLIIKGTPSSNPRPNTIKLNENQFDLLLADVTINKSATEIKEENIKDMRNTEFCGWTGGKVLEENVGGIKQSISSTSYRIFSGGLKIVTGEYKVSEGHDAKAHNVFYKIINNLQLPIKFSNKNSMKVFVNSTTAYVWANGTINSENSINLILSNMENATTNDSVTLHYIVVGY